MDVTSLGGTDGNVQFRSDIDPFDSETSEGESYGSPDLCDRCAVCVC